MTRTGIPHGTDGYAAQAEALVSQYESIAFSDIHAAILPLLPAPPAHVLDVGAGTGRDAAVFAALGYRGVGLTLDVHHLDPFAPDLLGRAAAVRQRLERHNMRLAVIKLACYLSGMGKGCEAF